MSLNMISPFVRSFIRKVIRDASVGPEQYASYDTSTGRT